MDLIRSEDILSIDYAYVMFICSYSWVLCVPSSWLLKVNCIRSHTIYIIFSIILQFDLQWKNIVLLSSYFL